MTQRKVMMTRMLKMAALSWADRWLLLQVFLLLGVARMAIRAVPFRRLARHLGPLHVETPAEASPEHLAQAQRIGSAIARVSPHTPWQSTCLPQALAAKVWLRRQRIPSTLYLGVALPGLGGNTGIEAHAWLRCGPLIVTGGRGRERFTVTALFGG